MSIMPQQKVLKWHLFLVYSIKKCSRPDCMAGGLLECKASVFSFILINECEAMCDINAEGFHYITIATPRTVVLQDKCSNTI